MGKRSKYLRVETVNSVQEPFKAQKLLQKHQVKTDPDAFLNPMTGQAGGGQVFFISDQRKKTVSFNDIATYKLKNEGARDKDPSAEPPDYRLQYFKGEEVFLNALINVTQQRQPRACFTAGHSEASIDRATPVDLRFTAELLKQQNFETEALEKVSGQVPVRCDILVVAGPRVPLQESEVSAIQAYLAKGGKLLFMARMLDLSGQAWSKSGLEELLSRFGVQLEDAAAIDNATRTAGLPLRDPTMPPVAWLVKDGWSTRHPIGKAMQGKVMRVDSPRALQTTKTPGIESMAVLTTQSKTDSWGERDLFGAVQFDPKRDLKGPVPVVVAARETKKNGARIIVLGSYLLVANYKLTPNQASFDYTKEFVLSAFNWLAEQESLVALPPRRPEHVKLKLSTAQVNRIARLVVLWLPLLAVMLGLIVWIVPTAAARRPRRKKPSKDDRPKGGV